jgi:hypothetical protein
MGEGHGGNNRERGGMIEWHGAVGIGSEWSSLGKGVLIMIFEGDSSV